MKLKFLLFLLVAILLPYNITFAAPPVGADYGVLMSSDGHPEFAYSIATDISVKKFLWPVVEYVEAGVLYSDRPWKETTETYVLRSFAVRTVKVGEFSIGLGAGFWNYVNTAGSDFSQKAIKTQIEYDVGPLNAHLGGDIVHFDGPDQYYVYGGLVISL